MKSTLRTAVLALLVVILVVGCTNTPSNNNADQPSTTNNTATSKPEESKPAETKPAEPVKFSLSLSDTNNKYIQGATDINKDKLVLELEKMANVDIDLQFVTHGEFKQKTALTFASKDLPDVMNVIQDFTPLSPFMSGAVKGGLFLPLDDLLKEHGQDLLNFIPQAAWDEVKYEGKIYAIPEFLSIPNRRATFMRKDYLDATGLSVPKTIDEYVEVLRAMKKNGVEQPFGFRENFVYADVIFGAYDVMPYSTMFEKIGDQILPKFFKTEEMMQALQLYKTMYDEGLMANDFASVTGPIWTKNISSGAAATWNHNANQLITWKNTAKQGNENAEVIIVPSPTGPDGQGGMMIYGATTRMSYLNSKLSDETAAGIVQFFNYLISDEAVKFFNYGIEGETYTEQDGKVVFTPPTVEGEETFRGTIFRLVKDDAINTEVMKMTEDGLEMIEAFDTIINKEGRQGVYFDPPLEANSKYTDAGLQFANVPPVLLEHMLRMIYGKEPISDWPKVLDEWKSKGGDEIIKEANDRFNNNDGVKFGKDAKVN